MNLIQDPKIRQVRRGLPNLDVKAKDFHLEFSKRTYIMGVLNVTPDSFSDGGRFFDKSKAIERALEMIDEGADIIDVGGESTRPGAADIEVNEEIKRVIPVIEGICGKVKVPISIDTRKSEVAQLAVEAGASIVNDISGLRYDRQMAAVVGGSDAALILMHIKGTPHDMQTNPVYGNLMAEIIESLRGSMDLASPAGVSEERIIVDPGIGFGKTVDHNLEILRRLSELEILKRPICIGTSRKSFIGKVLGIENPEERLAGTLATCVMAIMNGANMLRVHDVKAVRQAVCMADSVLRRRAG